MTTETPKPTPATPSRATGALARCAVALALLGAAIQWVHIAHRIRLFIVAYDCRPGVNHLADGFFRDAYLAHAGLMVLSGLALWRLWPVRWERIVACVPLALHILAVIALFVMHREGVLVEYGEFLRKWM